MKNKTLYLVLMLIFSLNIVYFSSTLDAQSYTWENVRVFNGTGWLTTATFTVTEDARFVWTTTYDDEYWADFHCFVYPEGEDIFYETDFSGLSGTSYLYEEGTFYMEIIEANTNSWQITVQQKDFGAPATTEDTELTPTEIVIGIVAFIAIAGGVAAYLLVKRKRSSKVQSPQIPPQTAVQTPTEDPAQIFKFCTQCGGQNDPSTSFCVTCGKKFE
ncbi:MAG: hypothetical protein GPJ51_02665 [Candidatus Heimdallarchaeota archaeon]|nr:hypothetical protein [Candidatus Heimdallarchaeota archaeon]